MRLSYRTKQTLRRLAIVFLIFLMLFIIAWFCSVVFLERYVVYTRQGAKLDMTISANEIIGEAVTPPSAGTNISIFYNEGDDAINMSDELQRLDGYYIDIDSMKTDLAGAWDLLEPLNANTPIMIDLKGGYGSAYYSSTLPGIITSSEVSVASVDELIGYMNEKNFYTIARISAFRDYNYGLNHVPAGLMHVNGLGLWPDEGHCYWLDPTKEETLEWIASIITEIKNMGFDEVVLTDFCFPQSDMVRLPNDPEGALLNAANWLINKCGGSKFAISFCTTNHEFALPDGRTRLYLDKVPATNVGSVAAKIVETMAEPQNRLVFLTQANDTRFNTYGVMRPLAVSPVIEAQKAAAATAPTEAPSSAPQADAAGRYG